MGSPRSLGNGRWRAGLAKSATSRNSSQPIATCALSLLTFNRLRPSCACSKRYPVRQRTLLLSAEVREWAGRPSSLPVSSRACTVKFIAAVLGLSVYCFSFWRSGPRAKNSLVASSASTDSSVPLDFLSLHHHDPLPVLHRRDRIQRQTHHTSFRPPRQAIEVRS